MKVRQANLQDTDEISAFLQELTQLGKRRLPSDTGYVRDHYIAHADTIRCSVALDDSGEILGLQILKLATEANPYGVDVGWGIIGTHVKHSAARRGVGKALFGSTQQAAHDADLTQIDATIGADNLGALAYYEAMGFRTYKTLEDAVCKRYGVS